jgi:transcriptional regulator with XRE-family HTH domain
MRYEAVSAELIRAVRGKRSQLAFSRHLGYRCNVLYTWESGRRWPTIATFVRAALRTRIDVFAGLQSFVGADADWLTADVADPKQLAVLLDKLRGTTPVAELARRVGINRVSVSRWLHGQAEPRLPDFLQLVEAACGRALDFIALFVEPRLLPECESAWRELEAQRQVAYGLPWSHAVLRVLELVEYQALPEHEDAWIAARLGISNSEVSTCMPPAQALGRVTRAHGGYAAEPGGRHAAQATLGRGWAGAARPLGTPQERYVFLQPVHGLRARLAAHSRAPHCLLSRAAWDRRGISAGRARRVVELAADAAR